MSEHKWRKLPVPVTFPGRVCFDHHSLNVPALTLFTISIMGVIYAYLGCFNAIALALSSHSYRPIARGGAPVN